MDPPSSPRTLLLQHFISALSISIILCESGMDAGTSIHRNAEVIPGSGAVVSQSPSSFLLDVQVPPSNFDLGTKWGSVRYKVEQLNLRR